MTAARTSNLVSSVSALVLGVAGIVLLFAGDTVLPHITAVGTGPAAILGQMIAAGWIAVAWLNWTQRHAIIGGIYGRPTVVANVAIYFITAMGLARPAMAAGAAPGLQLVALVFALFALVYAALMMRGPFGAITPAAG